MPTWCSHQILAKCWSRNQDQAMFCLPSCAAQVFLWAAASVCCSWLARVTPAVYFRCCGPSAPWFKLLVATRCYLSYKSTSYQLKAEKRFPPDHFSFSDQDALSCNCCVIAWLDIYINKQGIFAIIFKNVHKCFLYGTLKENECTASFSLDCAQNEWLEYDSGDYLSNKSSCTYSASEGNSVGMLTTTVILLQPFDKLNILINSEPNPFVSSQNPLLPSRLIASNPS